MTTADIQAPQVLVDGVTLLVREFEEFDREGLRALFLAARDEVFWRSSHWPQLTDFDSSTDHEKILVATIATAQVGFASIWEPDSFLHNLFVHPEFQRRGVGKALLEACFKYFSRPPTLKCLKANVKARQFYESQGWRVIGEGETSDGPYFLMSPETGGAKST